MTVDIDALRSLMTVLAFVSFLGIVLWAYSGRTRRRFEEAAQLPFAEDEAAGERGENRR
jgi:cytochrome c oxidase cbb3-type subunit 4